MLVLAADHRNGLIPYTSCTDIDFMWVGIFCGFDWFAATHCIRCGSGLVGVVGGIPGFVVFRLVVAGGVVVAGFCGVLFRGRGSSGRRAVDVVERAGKV